MQSYCRTSVAGAESLFSGMKARTTLRLVALTNACDRAELDLACGGDETRQLVLSLGMVPVVPPKSNRIDPWRYDRTLYKKRNEIERLFRRMKGYRRIFSRFEKLDLLFLGFLAFAFIVEALR
jgi:transposase